ncbi:MAG: type VI secretion system tube protein Hcp, partial [Planctomycetes bacterium]|nr:type VI secretion system tube protein Hcp [Planctomycetota bacterium]
MPTPCNLRVAAYPGSSEKESREDTIDVFEIEHHLHQPTEPTTGEATGVRVHSPLRVVAALDKATPGFHKA